MRGIKFRERAGTVALHDYADLNDIDDVFEDITSALGFRTEDSNAAYFEALEAEGPDFLKRFDALEPAE